MLPVAKAGPADDERPGESATGLEAEEISKMAAGAETEGDGPWMAYNRQDQLTRPLVGGTNKNDVHISPTPIWRGVDKLFENTTERTEMGWWIS